MNKYSSIYLIYCLVFTFELTHFAHARHLQGGTLNTNNVRFQSMSIDDGLPSQFVFQTYQQRNGFIWFATDRGASRYDGESFRNYSFSPGTPTHITNNFVRQIFEDKRGNIWLLTEDGLNKIRPTGELDHFKSASTQVDSINSNWQHFIMQDSNERIWIGTSDGLNLYQADTNTFVNIVGYKKNSSVKIPVNQMIEIGKNKFMLGTRNGIAFFNASDRTFTLESDRTSDTPKWFKDTILAMQISQNGQVLIGTQAEGLIEFELKTRKYTQHKSKESLSSIPENTVVSILERLSGELLIGHKHSGLTLISADRKKFTNFVARDFDDTSLISNEINHVFSDQSGLIWVSTRLGVSTYSYLKNSSSLIRKEADNSGLSGMVVFNSIQMDNDHILIATSSGMDKLSLSDGKIEYLELLSPEQQIIPNIQVKDIAKDSKGNFWSVSALGLHQYNPVSGKINNYLNFKDNPWGLAETELYTVFVDPSDNIWLTGHEDAGLVKFTPKEGVTQRFLIDPLHSYRKERHYTFDKIMAKNGDIWLATTNGVYRLNPQTGLDQHIRVGNYSSRENILSSSIIEDTNGDIWVTTQGEGLIRATVNTENKVELTHFTVKDGLVSNELLTVSAHSGVLWLSTKDLIFSYDPTSKESKSYPSLLNLPGLIFEPGSQTIINEFLYIGSNKGLINVNLKQIESNLYNAPIQITEIKSDEQDLLYVLDSNNQKKVDISYKNNNVSFSYAALDFNNPSANRYRYFLEGVDKNWVEAEKRQHVSYNNLSAGTYTFKVTASNSDGKWSDKVASFSFEIKQSWMFFAFIALTGLLALALLLFIFNRRLHIKTLYQKANYDSLTGVANRYYFNKYIEELVTESKNPFTLLIVDLDGFKEVNDIYGHSVGDELLIQASLRMRSVLRDKDLLARLGGDEFAIIINKPSQSNDLLKITERLRQTLASDYELTSHIVKASASIGAASYPSDSKQSDSLLIYADTAMFAAKQSGRNSVRFFNEALSLELEKRTELMQKLQAAIANEEFKLYYQPQIDQFSNRITGFESLIRWIHPDGTSTGPNIFIPEAERNGSIIEIGRWVLLTACKQAAAWQLAGFSFGKISVNVSAAQITKSDLVTDVKNALREHSLAPEFLELEITETILVDNIDLTVDILTKLKHIGVSVALDDFGTGYSSLNYLTRFPLDTLKIDRSFIQSVETDTDTKIVLKNIYTLANDLSMKVVAEGVETEAQLQILASLHGRIIQGYYYSPAICADDATELLQAAK